MGTFTDLTGKRSGVLIARTYLGESQWDCECDVCGNHVRISTYWFQKNIELGRDGCKHVRAVQIGDTYGHLTVVRQDEEDYVKPSSGKRERKWICRCDCGREKSILECNLKTGKSISCGMCGNRISIPEKAILYYLSASFPSIQENYRPSFLEGKEIDIYIPELMLGIEYDGERWHGDLEKDLWKTRVCMEHGVTLLRVREPNCPPSDELSPCIVTPKPIMNGTHMTEPIRQLTAFINETYHRGLNVDVDCLRDNAEICKTLVNAAESRSLAELFPEIAKEWDYEKNAPITPKMVAAHSGKKAYWTCENGHRYSSVIASRTGPDACGCPVCSNRGMALFQHGAYVGEHSLLKEAPEIAKEFDEEKNGVSADQIAVASNRKVWWTCSVCGHGWQAKVNNRTSSLKTGCPQCAKDLNKQGNRKKANQLAQKGSLQDNHPELCREWDHDKNIIKPTELTSGSVERVWWRCERGHSYQAQVYRRAMGERTGCPYCANKKVLAGYNDLAQKHPYLLEEWDYEKNIIAPTEVLAGSHRKVWWKCCYCRAEYEASIEKRAGRALGCVQCRKKQNNRHS